MLLNLVERDDQSNTAYFTSSRPLSEDAMEFVEDRLVHCGVPILEVRSVQVDGVSLLVVEYDQCVAASATVSALSESIRNHNLPESRSVFKAKSRMMLRDFESGSKWSGPMVVEPGDSFLVLGVFTADNIVVQLKTGPNEGRRAIIAPVEWDTIIASVERDGHIGDDYKLFPNDSGRDRFDTEGADGFFRRTGHDERNGKEFNSVIRSFPDFPSRKSVGDHFQSDVPKLKKKSKKQGDDKVGDSPGKQFGGSRPGGSRPGRSQQRSSRPSRPRGGGRRRR